MSAGRGIAEFFKSGNKGEETIGVQIIDESGLAIGGVGKPDLVLLHGTIWKSSTWIHVPNPRYAFPWKSSLKFLELAAFRAVRKLADPRNTGKVASDQLPGSISRDRAPIDPVGEAATAWLRPDLERDACWYFAGKLETGIGEVLSGNISGCPGLHRNPAIAEAPHAAGGGSLSDFSPKMTFTCVVTGTCCCVFHDAKGHAPDIVRGERKKRKAGK